MQRLREEHYRLLSRIKQRELSQEQEWLPIMDGTVLTFDELKECDLIELYKIHREKLYVLTFKGHVALAAWRENGKG